MIRFILTIYGVESFISFLFVDGWKRRCFMQKLRFNLLVCLIIIFIITIVGFLLNLVGDSGTAVSGAAVTGAAVGAVGEGVPWYVVIPAILFIGFIILTIFYLEKR